MLKITKDGYKSLDLTLTFGPGLVRYLDPRELVADSGASAIAEIEAFGSAPTIKYSSEEDIWPSAFGYNKEYNSYLDNPSFKRFNFHEFPPLSEERPLQEILRDLAQIVTVYSKSPFNSEAYWAFHQYTESTALVLDEFLDSWMFEASFDNDLKQSYSNSDDHLLLTVGQSQTYVFKKSNYIEQRRMQIDVAAAELVQLENQRVSEEAESKYEDTIRRSSFKVFTYLMGDTRNGRIKIGKSKNPQRREKTLQSEAPSVELRIAVPTGGKFESILHRYFAHLRRRGEWFELSAPDIKNAIEQMLTEGDPSRVICDKAWLGEIFISAFVDNDSSEST